MNQRARQLAISITAGAMVLAPVLALAPSASADTTVTLTSQQLTQEGFPKKPNVAAWGGGTASLPTHSAAQWADVIITGKAPAGTPVGQILTMSRYVPADTKGDGAMKPLNITAVVQKNLTYSMHFQLGLTGTYGYAVGYATSSWSPEFIGFQFQFTTTGAPASAPASTGSSKAVQLSSKQLSKAGFTKTVNVVGWGGTAKISSSKVAAGAPVTISGTAPAYVKPGSVLSLERFVPTDKLGSGSMEAVPGVQTLVAADGTFSLTFEINTPGLYGYTLGVAQNEEWIGMEFQLATT